MMNRTKWSPPVLLRYIILQIPGIAFFTLVVVASYYLDFLPPWLAWGFWTVWIIKDIVVYPLVWKSYIPELRKSLKTMVGETAVTTEKLDPSGYVKINGETWKAELEKQYSGIAAGEEVIISDVRGLKLIVKPR